MSNVFGADDALLAFALHLAAAKSEEGCRRQIGLQCGNQVRAVMVAAGLAGGEKDMRIGRRADVSV